MAYRNNKKKPTVLGLLFEGSDPSAALIMEGKIIAVVEEERMIREKHAAWKFPIKAVNYCLDTADITLKDVDFIATGWEANKFPSYMRKFYAETEEKYSDFFSARARDWQAKNLHRYTKESLTKQLKENILKTCPKKDWPKIVFINHHRAHACSAIMMSGFDDALIVTADGHGEDDATNIWIGENDEIKHVKQWQLPHSLGWFYTKFTQFLGFRAHDGEGKLMGLAAYGRKDPELFEKVDKIITFTGEDDIYKINAKFFYGDYEKENYTKEWLEIFGEPLPFEIRTEYSDYHKNLAYAVQKKLEDIMLNIVEHAIELTGKQNICVAGGTFMNCKMNGEIAKKYGYDKLFVQPIAGDNGISLGSALAVYLNEKAGWKRERLNKIYFGPEYDQKAITSALKKAGLKYIKSKNVEKDTAKYVANSKIVGWYQGKMEVGARALGNRSIIANPLDPKTNNIVNMKVKFRETWRPFCPSTMVEDGKKYFDYNFELPFMVVACEARAGFKTILPSAIHVDNTVRVQTVSKETNPKFHNLIREFKEITGYGVVINTSFNLKGEPIVNTPENAIDTFLNSGMDVLVIGDYIIDEKANLVQGNESNARD